MTGTVKSVIETYNKRGARERDFDRLNNDFGWKHLPCSFLNENTVYMILTAFCMNFFSYFIRAVSSVFTSLSPTSRVKKFVFQSPMGKGALCPNLNVFGFLSCRYAYARDKKLKNIRKDFVC